VRKLKLRDDLDRNERAGGIDLGFESQKPKIPLSAPWVFSGPLEVLEEAQSPFQEIHPKGKVGVRLGSGQITDGIRYVFKNGLTTTPGQEINFALDFRTLASETHWVISVLSWPRGHSIFGCSMQHHID
jgi:hypothetical protein